MKNACASLSTQLKIIEIVSVEKLRADRRRIDLWTITMSSEEFRMSEAAAIEKIVQDLKVSKIDTIFLNRKPLEVKYYFEYEETEQFIMIDVDSLLPILGGFRPTDTGSFETLDTLSALVKEYIYLNQCSNYQYADCICHLFSNRMEREILELEMNPSSSCRLKHFHHACGNCVNLWLNEYLRVLILRRESKPLFAKAAQEICSRLYISNDFDDFYNRECPELYLRIAQKFTIPEYILDDITVTWQ